MADEQNSDLDDEEWINEQMSQLTDAQREIYEQFVNKQKEELKNQEKKALKAKNDFFDQLDKGEDQI